MSTELPTRPAPEHTRIPGDFKRHPTSGAPFVADPNTTSKPKGKKADLLAMCERAGITPPPKATNPELIGLLVEAGVGTPRMVQYGRPSGFGKQIENATNLQKWAERAVALGVILSPDSALIDELVKLGADRLHLDDPDGRVLLDKIAAAAKSVAQADLAAARGTHAHALTEDNDTDLDWLSRVQAGQDLGLPAPVQAALVECWDGAIEASDTEILSVEAKCVDDRWRLGGTLDRVARLRTDLAFVIDGGEVVTLPAGTVVILDVKTGQLRLDNQGHPLYWHGYAIQLASYAQSLPYDVDLDQRGEWPWPINQEWAIIAHLDVLAALDGEARCTLILVDLTAGREAGDLVVAAKAWERRTDVFSLVPATTPFTVPVQLGEQSCESPSTIPTRSESTSSTTRGASSVTTRSTMSPASTPPLPALPTPNQLPTPPIPTQPSVRSSTPNGTPSTLHTGTTMGYSTPPPTTATSPTGTASPGRSGGSEDWRITPTGETTTPTTSIEPTTEPSGLPGEIVTVEQTRAEGLNGLAHLIDGWPDYTKRALAQVWPTVDVLPYPKQVRDGEAVWTDDHLPLLAAVLRAAEAPFNIYTNPSPQWIATRPAWIDQPPPHTGQEPAERADIDLLVNTIAASDGRDVVNRWLGEGHAAGVGWSPRKHPNVRAYEICRAALALADAIGDGADDAVLAVITAATDQTATTVGAALGLLAPRQAEEVHQYALDFLAGRVTITYDADGVYATRRTP